MAYLQSDAFKVRLLNNGTHNIYIFFNFDIPCLFTFYKLLYALLFYPYNVPCEIFTLGSSAVIFFSVSSFRTFVAFSFTVSLEYNIIPFNNADKET